MLSNSGDRRQVPAWRMVGAVATLTPQALMRGRSSSNQLKALSPPSEEWSARG